LRWQYSIQVLVTSSLEATMDGAELAFFLVSIFFGGLVSGFAGFALGLVVSPIWLHLFPPLQTATLIVGCGLVMQGYGTWKLRRSLDFRDMAPFIVGGAVGVPIGAMLLARIDPSYLRTGVGVLLLAYGTYGLARPHVRPLHVGVAADTTVGVFNGLLSGLTGLPGVIVTVWCQMRGWPKDRQRTTFQPVILATLMMSVVSLGAAGAVTLPTIKTFMLGLPLLLAGAWSGMKLYGHLDEAAFRKAILVILLISGLTLIVPFSWFG
jgi:hypothetical protein